MDIVVTEVTEHEDGSATLQIDMDNEALTALLQSAILDAIKKGLEIHESQDWKLRDSTTKDLENAEKVS